MSICQQLIIKYQSRREKNMVVCRVSRDKKFDIRVRRLTNCIYRLIEKNCKFQLGKNENLFVSSIILYGIRFEQTKRPKMHCCCDTFLLRSTSSRGFLVATIQWVFNDHLVWENQKRIDLIIR